MYKISCDICMDLMPLVKDEVASSDSKIAVEQHIKTCDACRELYGEGIAFESVDSKIVSKIKKHLMAVSMAVIALGILFGISLSSDRFMFYNILIMPLIGGISYMSLKKRSLNVCLLVFGVVYIRWVYHSFGHALQGDYILAFLPPFWWALIYFALTALGVLIAALLHFGFRREKKL